MKRLQQDSTASLWPRRLLAKLACVALLGTTSESRAQGKRGKEPPGPDPMVEMEKLKAELEKQLADKDTESRAREAALKKEQESSLEQLREESEKRLAAERLERQGEILRLQKALEEASARADRYAAARYIRRYAR